MKRHTAFIIILFGFLLACKEKPKNNHDSDKGKNEVNKPEVPAVTSEFDADTAYWFIERQVAFGPRIPNTAAHRKTADWLVKTLESYTDRVIRQSTTVKGYKDAVWNITNIIASFNPEVSERILLCAHWDTRPEADEDSQYPDKPADGADDGGSGVGVLLEVARQLSQSRPAIGIDIVLFDAEDGGGHGPNSNETWCLGSQYWAKNPHQSGYKARYGILLDMVGAKNAMFAKEKISLQFAPDVVNRVWGTGQRLGYGRFFVNLVGGQITDDHLYINKLTGIPTIDIINYNPYSEKGFGSHWHTLNDNLEIIDRASLRAAGHTVMQVIREDDAAFRKTP